MMQNWTKKITTKIEVDKKNSKIYEKDTINGYAEKKSMAYNIG